jgi:hypothetical protein
MRSPRRVAWTTATRSSPVSCLAPGQYRAIRRGIQMPKNTPMMTSTMTADNRNPESSHAKAPKGIPTAAPTVKALRTAPPRQTNAGTVSTGLLWHQLSLTRGQVAIPRNGVVHRRSSDCSSRLHYDSRGAVAALEASQIRGSAPSPTNLPPSRLPRRARRRPCIGRRSARTFAAISTG